MDSFDSFTLYIWRYANQIQLFRKYIHKTSTITLVKIFIKSKSRKQTLNEFDKSLLNRKWMNLKIWWTVTLFKLRLSRKGLCWVMLFSKEDSTCFKDQSEIKQRNSRKMMLNCRFFRKKTKFYDNYIILLDFGSIIKN